MAAEMLKLRLIVLVLIVCFRHYFDQRLLAIFIPVVKVATWRLLSRACIVSRKLII